MSLSKGQIKLLIRGPKFCPTTAGNFFDFKNDTRCFTRRLITQEKYHDSNYVNDSIVRGPSKKDKYISSKNADLTNIINTVNKLSPVNINMESNITTEEDVALKQLKKLSEETVEIKKADKSNTLVIMDKEVYKQKLVLQDHLLTETYKKAPANSNDKVFKKLSKLVSKHSSCLTKKEKVVVLKADWKDSFFYVLPKIHKSKEIKEAVKKVNEEYIHIPFPDSLKGRPINGGPQAVTQGASHLLEKLLTPLVCNMKSYIKDEWDFLRKIPSKITYPATLLTCDIVSLYTSIPTELGLKALEYWIDRLSHLIPSRFTKPFILQLAEFVLTNNFTNFEDELWHQLKGTSMGTKMAPPYACLTIGYLEETILFPTLLPSKFNELECQRIIELFFRFMDDGSTFFPDNSDKVVFLTLLNSMDESIQYTVEEPEVNVVDDKTIQNQVFLSINLHLDDQGNVWTNVHYKDTNGFDYLSWDSHHPRHTKENIPYCLAKRIIVMSSKEEDTDKNLRHLQNRLVERGYPAEVIERGFFNAKLQGPANIKNDKVIPLVSTYFSNYSNSTVVEVTRQLIERSKDQRLRTAFKDVKFVEAFKQPPNLLKQVSHSAFRSTNEPGELRKKGLFKCKRPNCKICKLYIQEGDSFVTAKGETWEVRCYADCHSLNVVYYLSCLFCSMEETYAGKTDVLRARTNQHISDIKCGRGGKFDEHIRQCAKKHHKNLVEPFFQLRVFFVLKRYSQLLDYEAMIHASGHDTMNRPTTIQDV